MASDETVRARPMLSLAFALVRESMHKYRIWSGVKRPSRRRLGLFVLLLLLSTMVYHYMPDPDARIIKMSDEDLMRRKRVKQVKNLKFSERDISSSIDLPFQIGCREIDLLGPRANAAFVMLAQNHELDDVIKSIVSLERHFNQWFNYPWVFLNDQEFDETFKLTVQKYTQTAQFGRIDPEAWEFPDSIDKDELYEYINSQGDRRIYYGNKESYHKMCRYFSNQFFFHPLVQQLDWYWRVEPNVEFFCDITYDPFIEMEKHGKKYGFNVMIHELYYTVPGLFRETKAFATQKKIKPSRLWRMMVKYFRFSRGDNEQRYDMLKKKEDILRELEHEVTIETFLAQQGKKDLSQISKESIAKLIEQSSQKPLLHEDRIDYEEYNLCHFWSNFEIARTDLFTSRLYQQYIKHLEESGGFYKERWGDAAVHSLGLAMMLDAKDVHYFRDIGYKHSTLTHCPGNAKVNQLPYIPSENNHNNPEFQLYKPSSPVINGVGCRCKCPMFYKEVEDSKLSCLKQWVRTTRDDYVQYMPIDRKFYKKKIEYKLGKYLASGGKLGESEIYKSL